MGRDAGSDATEPRRAPHADQSRVEPLTAGWIALTVCIGIMAALIGLGGMVLSFRSVRDEMTPTFGPDWAWLVPIVVDLTVFVFSGVDLVLSRLDMSHPLARWTVYGATGGTVWLNYSAGGSAAGRTAHILMPSIWVVFVELMRHVVRRQTNLATGSRREPIPTARWLLSPLPTFLLFRRMALWRTNSYTAALDQERSRLRTIAGLREKHGRWWRRKADPLTRLELSLGPMSATPPAADDTPAPHPADATPAATGPGVTVAGDTPPSVTANDTPPPVTLPRDTPAAALADTPLPVTARHATPRPHPTRHPVTPDTRDTVTALPLANPAADAATLLAATPPEWQALSNAEAMRRVDEILPGRTASQVAALLATVGVTVKPVDVRKTRERARKAAAREAAASADDQEAEAA